MGATKHDLISLIKCQDSTSNRSKHEKKSKLYEAKIPYSVTIFNSTPRRASICDKKMETHCGKKKLYTETT